MYVQLFIVNFKTCCVYQCHSVSFQLKAIIAESHRDLDEAERAAAEEGVDVDEFVETVSVPVPVLEHQPTPVGVLRHGDPQEEGQGERGDADDAA